MRDRILLYAIPFEETGECIIVHDHVDGEDVRITVVFSSEQLEAFETTVVSDDDEAPCELMSEAHRTADFSETSPEPVIEIRGLLPYVVLSVLNDAAPDEPDEEGRRDVCVDIEVTPRSKATLLLSTEELGCRAQGAMIFFGHVPVIVLFFTQAQAMALADELSEDDRVERREVIQVLDRVRASELPMTEGPQTLRINGRAAGAISELYAAAAKTAQS